MEEEPDRNLKGTSPGLHLLAGKNLTLSFLLVFFVCVCMCVFLNKSKYSSSSVVCWTCAELISLSGLVRVQDQTQLSEL